MSDIIISVIVPIYNVELYLKRCIDSLLSQDFDHKYEIILVDDGSPDKSGEIADEYADKYSIIKTVHKENGGLSSARNYGVEFATGDYISFVDSDDYVSETYLKDMYTLIKKYDADIVACHICLVTEEEAKITYPEDVETKLVGADEALWDIYFLGKASWTAYAKLIKKEIVKKHPFPDGYYEDQACMYLMLSETDKIVISDLRNNYHYIRRPGSITACKLSDKHLRIYDISGEFSAFLKDKYSDWEALSALSYQNSTLQLLTRINMPKDDFNKVFNRTVSISRQNLFKILKLKRIGIGVKYYSVVLSTTPEIFKLQRLVLLRLHIIKKNWL